MKVYSTYRNKRTSLSLKQYAYYITYYKYNWHRDVELIMLLEGEIEVNIHGESYVLKEGDLMLINSNVGHATMAKRSDSIAMVLHFSPEYFSIWYKEQPFFQLKFSNLMNEIKKRAYDEIKRKLLQMTVYTDFKSKKDEIIYEALFHGIIAELFLHFAPESPDAQDTAIGSGSDKILKIIDYINNHYRDKITLDVLQDVTGYNKSYISQLIKQDLGINYYEYLTRVRMREAIFSLTNTTDRIADIALGNGFSDVKSFNSAFKERFGKSPSEYRKNLVHSQKQGSSHDKIYVEIEKYDEIIREWLKNEGSKEIQEDCDKSHSIEARNRIIAEVSEELRDLNERFENLELKFNKLK